MKKIAKNITELVGNTPLVEISKFSEGANAKIIAKLESFNPMGSVKDRIALMMITEAENKGLLKRNSIIVEATSGNTGIGLAFVAAQKGYEVILTMPETMSVERQKLLKALGAKLVLTEGSKGMKGAIAKADELSQTIVNSFRPKQFENLANPKAH